MPNRFKNILVPYDNSKNSFRALNKAITVANLTNTAVTLTHVIPYNKSGSKIDKAYLEANRKNVNKFMHKAREYTIREGVKGEQKILYGNITEEILKFMDKKKFDLVIVGRRGSSNSSAAYVGSISNALVQRSRVPVLVVT